MGRYSTALKSVMPEDVETYLRENPNCLLERPDLMRTLTPPSRFDNGDPVSDFQQAMINGLRDDLDRLSETSANIVSMTQRNLSQQQRTHAAVMRLMQAATPADFHHILTEEWPGLLEVDAIALVLEDDQATDMHAKLHEGPNGIVRVPKGMIDGIFLGNPTQQVILTPDRAGNILFGDLAHFIESDALARFDLAAPWECPNSGTAKVPVGLLAVGSFTHGTFHPEQATDLLGFLARMLGCILTKWCGLTP